MNRAERRKRQKKGLPVSREPVYNMKRSDLNKMKSEATDSAVETAIVLLLALPIKVLKDKYGWGSRKRLPEFAEALTDEYQRFAEGEMTLEQYQELVFEYCGMKFQRNDD